MTRASFIRNISLRFALTLPVNFRGIIVLPLLTRLYTQDIYGAWLQVILIGEVFRSLLSLRLGTALVRYLSGESNPKIVIKAVFTVVASCSLCFILLVGFFGSGACRVIFGSSELRPVLMVASFWISIQACMMVGLNVLRSQEKIGRLSIIELLSSLWLVCAVAISYLMGFRLERLIVACLLGDAALLVWVLVQIGVYFPMLSLKKTAAVVKKFLPYSAPLIFNTLFFWFTRSIDRFLIVQLLGLSLVGVYGVSLQVTHLLSIVVSPINFVLFPRVASSWNLRQEDQVKRFFSQAVSLTVVLSAPIVVGIFIVSDGLISLLAGQGYTSSTSLVLFLLLSVLANMIYQNHLYAIHLKEKTHLLPVLFIATAALNYGLCYLLVLRYGILGAAIARFLTLGIMALVVTWWARSYFRFPIAWGLVAKAIGVSILMGLSISWLPDNTWIQLLSIFTVGAIVYLLLLVAFRVLTFEQLWEVKRQFI